MKNSQRQRGFANGLILTVIAIVIVGGAVYLYKNKDLEKASENSEKTLPAQTQTQKLNDPFARLPEARSFSVTSSDFAEGDRLPTDQLSGIFGAGGKDISPELSWTGAPEGTKSYAVTVYDPDAPTGSGFWHWAVANIPANATKLERNAGDPSAKLLPAGAFQLPNDARAARFIGAAPPAGHGKHRYFFVVYALDVADIGVGKDVTPAFLGFNMSGHTLGRAVLTAWAETVKP